MSTERARIRAGKDTLVAFARFFYTAFSNVHSGLAGGCFRKKMKFELALLWDSLDPYGSRKNEKKLH